MTLTVLNHFDGRLHVHRTGCRDIAKQRINGKWELPDGLTDREIGEDAYADQIDEGSMTIEAAEAEVYRLPCAVAKCQHREILRDFDLDDGTCTSCGERRPIDEWR